MLFIQLQPTGNNPDGKVADLTLTYHTPGSDQPITQSVTLQYANDPTETPDPPYLSAPEMAPRFAMYNMFLGLRAATVADNPNCAAVDLANTRAAATAWNQEQENPDIAADLTLVDLYRSNLATIGADISGQYTLATCEQSGLGNGGDDTDYPYPEDPHPEALACNVGRTPFALAPLGLAVLAVIRRRRRR
jgi:hypothetical protein